MKSFTQYLAQIEEVGTVEEIMQSIIYVRGLPGAHPNEVVIFESGQIGYIFTLNHDFAEVLLLSQDSVNIGTRVTRTNKNVQICVKDSDLGKAILLESSEDTLLDLDDENADARVVDQQTAHFTERCKIVESLETGVTLVDLIIPLGKGQRELVIGDRKTGKTTFLLQTLRSQVQKGRICIYAAIAKPLLEIQLLKQFLINERVNEQTIVVASQAGSTPGLVFLTPYIAMTMAEHFRDQGKDVVLILDDLTTHARYYREIMLLAKRFPGRSSYPGDIFYIHARLMERAGNFQKGSISCFPVAQSVLGDLSGYIQSNLMSMTDGHIFFDRDFFDQGRRPPIHAALSVTRVGEQTQSPLMKNLNRQLRSFLISYDKLKGFTHFQTELGEDSQDVLDLGDRLIIFMDQLPDWIIPVRINAVLCAAIWTGFWRNIPLEQMKKELYEIIHEYKHKPEFTKEMDALVDASKTFNELITKVKEKQDLIFSQVKSLSLKIEQKPVKEGT